MVNPNQPQEHQEYQYDQNQPYETVIDSNVSQQVNYKVSNPSESNLPPAQYAQSQVPQNPQMGVYGSAMPQHLNEPAQGIPVMQVGAQPWRTGLFGCFEDPGNAIMTFCCPCVTFGKIAEILDQGDSSCCSCALAYVCITYWIGCPCILSCGYRTKLRNKFGLSESPIPDCLVHCFCEWCALCQEYRELNLRGLDPDLGWQGNVNRNIMQQRPMEMMPPTNQTMNHGN